MRLSTDPSTTDVLAALSTPVAPEMLRRPDLSRRRFLQASGVAGAATLLPGWLAEAAAAATPLRPDEGVLVLLTMNGGNDGLNTFVPVADGAYYDARRDLALPAGGTIPLTDRRALHPRLQFMKAAWDAGRLAVIEGVGHGDATLSHFVSMAQVMAANADGRPGTSGWLGRVIDTLPGSPLDAVAIGNTVPLVVQGRRHRASAVPLRANDLRQIDASDPVLALQYDAIRAAARSATGLGPLGDRVAAGLGQAIDLAGDLRPLIPAPGDEPAVVSEMRLAARLINANLGIRIISVAFGDFDTHANHASMHDDRMTELDAALRAFDQTLDPTFAGRTLVLGTSEFGRRVEANHNGTDHGTANALFALGAGVNGGFWGQAPSLTALDAHGNLAPQVDYRQVYANVVDTWLGADPVEVLGRDWGDLGFLRTPLGDPVDHVDGDGDGGGDGGGGGGGSDGDPAGAGPAQVTPYRVMRAEVARLYLAYFLRAPDEEGFEYWYGVRRGGRALPDISSDFAESEEFRRRYGSLSNRQFINLVYRNVLERAPDDDGLGHWLSALDRGAPKGLVMLGFSESIEFRNRMAPTVEQIEANGAIGRLYRAYFLRAPDTEGLHYWLDTGLPPSSVSEQFATSTEFRNRYGDLDDRAFVTTAYRNVLGREPDGAGLEHWVGVLRRGASRGSVMLGFSDSPEFVRRVQTLA